MPVKRPLKKKEPVSPVKKYLPAAALIVSLIIEIFLILSMILPVSVNRPRHAKAIARWMLDRSPANERMLRQEFAQTKKIAASKRQFLIILLFANTAAAVILSKNLLRATATTPQ